MVQTPLTHTPSRWLRQLALQNKMPPRLACCVRLWFVPRQERLCVLRATLTARLFRSHLHKLASRCFLLCPKPSAKKQLKACWSAFRLRVPRRFEYALTFSSVACKVCGLAPIHFAKRQKDRRQLLWASC